MIEASTFGLPYIELLSTISIKETYGYSVNCANKITFHRNRDQGE
jgi:hypothetical protein